MTLAPISKEDLRLVYDVRQNTEILNESLNHISTQMECLQSMLEENERIMEKQALQKKNRVSLLSRIIHMAVRAISVIISSIWTGGAYVARPIKAKVMQSTAYLQTFFFDSRPVVYARTYSWKILTAFIVTCTAIFSTFMFIKYTSKEGIQNKSL